MKPSLIAGLTLLAFSTTAGAAEQNVALATAGAVVVADSEYLDSPYVPGGELARFLNDGKWIAPSDPPQSNRWHSALNGPELMDKEASRLGNNHVSVDKMRTRR